MGAPWYTLLTAGTGAAQQAMMISTRTELVHVHGMTITMRGAARAMSEVTENCNALADAAARYAQRARQRHARARATRFFL